MGTSVEGLMDLGFSEYEAKAYVALVGLGTASGYQVAKESHVPRSTIYEVLSKLVMRGAALTLTFAEQVRYTAVPPNKLLGRIKSELESNLKAVAESLSRVAAPTTPGQTWNLEGRKNLFSYARQMIDQAKKEISLVVGDDDELDEMLSQLQDAKGRGLEPIVICPTAYDAGDVPVIVPAKGLSLRQAIGHGFALIVDRREALIGEVDRSQGAIWTTNRFAVAWLLWSLKEEAAGHRATVEPAPTDGR